LRKPGRVLVGPFEVGVRDVERDFANGHRHRARWREISNGEGLPSVEGVLVKKGNRQ
jgi:hypothetical protein